MTRVSQYQDKNNIITMFLVIIQHLKSTFFFLCDPLHHPCIVFKPTFSTVLFQVSFGISYDTNMQYDLIISNIIKYYIKHTHI